MTILSMKFDYAAASRYSLVLTRRLIRVFGPTTLPLSKVVVVEVR